MRDIIILVGGGGMSGVFSAGVLKSFEDSALYDRVQSVYAVSVGGCTGARFLARESELGGKTFYTRFNSDRFIKNNFVRYFFQILWRKHAAQSGIDEILDFNYFTEILLRSEDKIDMSRVAASGISLYVKVFNNTKKTHQYLRVEGPHAYERVLASASMTPLTSSAALIEGEEFFDGDTIPSDIEMDIVKSHPGKRIIRIENSKNSFLGDFNLPVLLVVYALLHSLYGAQVSGLYFVNFFKKPFWRRQLAAQKNVLTISSSASLSPFCKDARLLKEAYDEGLKKGREALAAAMLL